MISWMLCGHLLLRMLHLITLLETAHHIQYHLHRQCTMDGYEHDTTTARSRARLVNRLGAVQDRNYGQVRTLHEIQACID